MSPPSGAPDGLDGRARQELHTYRRHAWIFVAAGLALLVGFVVAASWVAGAAEELEETGARVPGTVVERRGSGEDGSIVVEFSWEEELRTEVVQLDAESPRYQRHQPVTVLVDRDNPGRVSVLGEWNQSELTVLPMVLALVGGVGMLITGVWGLVRARRQRRLLERTGWRRVACCYAEINSGRSVRALVVLDEADGSKPVLTLASVGRWRLGKSGFRQATAVDVAGSSNDYVVLRAPDEGPLMTARPPATRRAEKRWRRAVLGASDG